MIDVWHSGWAGVHIFDKLRERIRMNIFSGLYGIHGGHGGIGIKELRERVHSMMDPYYFSYERMGLRERVMNCINHYRTDNLEEVCNRCEEYLNHHGGRGNKNYNINRIGYFKDIPDGIEILIDYVDVTAIRTMNIPIEIIYESIYRELPELFEE